MIPGRLSAWLLPLTAVLALGAPACVDSSAYEKSMSQLEDVRHAAAQKDDQLRAYQWQLGALAQQLREGQQRSDALQRELFAQVQQLTATNASLAERLKKAESDRAGLLSAAAAAADAPPARDGKGPRPEELRRMLAAADARNAQIVDELARIERLLGNSGGPRIHGGETAGSKPGVGDVVDPWGFGSRK
jgi:septal ring factor EnvC (AmiA/AmiB activator)